MNTTVQVNLSITTGNFMRTIFPSWVPFCNEFDMTQSFQIKTGIWGDSTTDKNDTSDTLEENDESGYKSNIASRQGGTDICFLLFIFMLIMLISVVVLWVIRYDL